MNRSWSFHFVLCLMALVSVITLIFAEYSFDAASSALAILLAGLLLFALLFSFLRAPRPLHRLIRYFFSGVTFLCGLGLLVILLTKPFENTSVRAFAVAHITMVVMACKFITAYRTRDYTTVFIISILLMVVSAMECESIILVPLFLLYMFIAGYGLILYQFQRQVEFVITSRFIGFTPSAEELEQAKLAVRDWWSSLGRIRFTITCGIVVTLAILLAAVVFFGFPRLESGSLLGGKYSSTGITGFSDQLVLGAIQESKTQRNVVARVSIEQSGPRRFSENDWLYFRCVALDSYQNQNDEFETEDFPFSWSRSLMRFAWDNGGAASSDDQEPPAPLVVQEVLLSPQSSPYLPSLFHIQSVESISQVKVNITGMDRAAECLNLSNSGPIWYRVDSLAEITLPRAGRLFHQQLDTLGYYWAEYASDRRFFSPAIFDIASAVADELLPMRNDLQKEQNFAFQRWWRHKSQIEHLDFPMMGAWDEFPSLYPPHPSLMPAPSPGWLPRRPAVIVPEPSEQAAIVAEPSEQAPPEPNTTDHQSVVFAEQLYQATRDLADIDRLIAQRVVNFLISHYQYNEQPPPPVVVEDEEYPTDPIEEFLAVEQSQGNCEYFASAMAMLCRSIGLKARVAVGYLVNGEQADLDYYLVRQSDAHTWVEIYTADQDWVPFDPTPPEEVRPQHKPSPGYFTGLMQKFSNYLESLQYRWLKFNATQEGGKTLRWANQVRDWLEKLESRDSDYSPSLVKDAFKRWFVHNPEESYFSMFIRWMIFFCSLIVMGIGIRELAVWLIPKYLFWQFQRQQLKIYDHPAAAFYCDMLKILHEIHLYKEPYLTPREFALQSVSYADGFAPIGTISEMYYRVRYSNLELDGKLQESLDQAFENLRAFVLKVKNETQKPWPWQSPY